MTEFMEYRAPQAANPVRGWVLYDDSCRFCQRMAGRFARVLASKGFQVLPLQDASISGRLKLSPDELLREMRVISADGRISGGAVAVLALARHFWWGLPIYWVSRIPGCDRLLAGGYVWFAARRHCMAGACSAERDEPTHWTRGRVALAVTPLLLLPAAAAFLFKDNSPWMLMWTMAGSLWLGLKWATVVDAWRVGLRPTVRQFLAYALLWPNTDALRFLNSADAPKAPVARDWLGSLSNGALGIALLYGGVRLVYPASPWLSGWVGMIGLVFGLHFGLFKLLAHTWHRAGINASLLMNNPAKSTSLAEFWGRRWNTGFSDPARRYLHAPLAKRAGTAAATACVFLVSGLLHETVISFPAGSGYGLPTAYFLLQAVGLQIERSRTGTRLGLGRGFRGWTFTLLFTAGPAFLLFHSAFVREVILPFLHAIGALKGVAL